MFVLNKREETQKEVCETSRRQLKFDKKSKDRKQRIVITVLILLYDQCIKIYKAL